MTPHTRSKRPTKLASRTAVAVAFAFLAPVVLAQHTDVDGSKDHPAIPRMNPAAYFIADYDMADFDAATLPVGDDKEQAVEGHRWKIEYWLRDGAKRNTPIEISRNYRNAFASRGGTVVYAERDGVHTTLILKQPGGGALWLHVDVSNGGDVYELTIVETAAMSQQVEVSALALAKALADTGSVALHGILFDTGKATIKPESAETLKAVAEVLKADPELSLEIQGHTDNVGAKDVNLRLSQARAVAVQSYLVQTHGISAAHVTSAGFGDSRPVADNSSEQGRAQNRRVELVKK